MRFLNFPLDGWKAVRVTLLSEERQHHSLRSKLSANLVVSATYAALLREYGDHKALSEGRLVHARIIMGGGHGQICYLENLLVQMYGKCGAMEDARTIFCQMYETDPFSWNLLLGACVQNGECGEALQLFHRMQLESFLPNKHTFLNILAVCATQTSLPRGKTVHAYILSNGLVSDLVLETAIVNMYGKCRSVDDAKKMFDSMLQRNVISWNAMISAYAQQGQSRNALQLFQKMLLEGFNPSRVTFVSLLDACASQESLDKAKLMHFYVASSSFEFDIVVGTALVNMYGKCGKMEEAVNLFYKLPERSVVTWNAIIAVSAFHGGSMEAFQLFKEMGIAGVMPNKSTFVSVLSACANEENLVEGKYVHSCIVRSGITCDVVLGTALVSMYGKCGSLKDARVIFNDMAVCDVVAWTAMIAAYVQHGQGKEALCLVQEMPPGTLLLDNITFVSILDACATEGALAEGRVMHALVLDSEFESNVVVGTALVNMYSKCAKLEDARSVFNIMPQRDVVAWNAMIAAYAQHGQVKRVVNLFYQMQPEGVVPDDVTFICVLTACSHAGMVDEADRCFRSMKTIHGISPAVDHYNCMLDLFGRSGWIDKGEKLIISMPFQPSATSWMTLLSACRMHLNVQGGEQAARHVFEMEPEFGAPFVVLSNLYAVNWSVG